MLLINENLAVSRIINLIAHKENLEVEEFENIDSVIKNSYRYILIDNDSYQDGMLSDLKGRFKYKKLIFIAPKNGGKPLGFDDILFKPFLPTDFLKIVEKIDAKKKKTPIEKKLIKSEPVKIKPIESEPTKVDTPTPNIEREVKKEHIKKKVESLTKQSISSLFSNDELKELLKDIEININISFKVKE